jgi:hypothetical protein
MVGQAQAGAGKLDQEKRRTGNTPFFRVNPQNRNSFGKTAAQLWSQLFLPAALRTSGLPQPF